MSNTINFSVHPNPRPDAEGRTTYQVRHETYTTVSTAALADHLQHHGLLRPELLTTVLNVLKRELVEHLTLNRRVHLEGLGTFYLKIGLRSGTDDEGNELRPTYTLTFTLLSCKKQAKSFAVSEICCNFAEPIFGIRTI